MNGHHRMIRYEDYAQLHETLCIDSEFSHRRITNQASCSGMAIFGALVLTVKTQQFPTFLGKKT